MKTPAISDTPARDTVHPLTISELEHTATNAVVSGRVSVLTLLVEKEPPSPTAGPPVYTWQNSPPRKGWATVWIICPHKDCISSKPRITRNKYLNI